MRHAAQRSLELQNLLPAQSGSSGLPYMVSSKLISDAVDKWEKSRGLQVSVEQIKAAHWREALAHKQRKKKEIEEAAVKEKPVRLPKIPKPRVLNQDQKERQKEARKKYKELNRDKIREEKRLAAQRRRDAMTPEQRKEESRKIQAYNKARLERQRLNKQ